MNNRMILLAGVAVFTLASIAAEPAHVRALPLDGSKNFRDLGGYETVDGHHVKWGLVFRSDAPAKLTDKDYETVLKLGIRTVCDFRTSFEREREPTHWPGDQPDFMLLDMGAGQQKNVDPARAFLKPLLDARAKPEQAAEMMRQMMKKTPIQEGAQIGKMLSRLVDTRDPLLFHCTAGKDRTGLASAFLLKTLGVKEEQIYQDYLLVNMLMPPERYAAVTAQRLEAMTGQKLDPQPFMVLMGTRREWLEAAFASINDKYGSFDRYRREVLGLSDADVLKMKRRLLE